MKFEPDFPVFSRIHDQGRGQAVFVRRIADLETPVSAYMKLAGARENAFLLESVQGGDTRGRYSVIGIDPDVVWRCHDGRAEIIRDPRFNGPATPVSRPTACLGATIVVKGEITSDEDLQIDGKASPELIFIGAKSEHPKEAAFALPAKPVKK